MNSILLAMVLISAPPSFEAHTLDGRAVSGPLLELTADRATMAAKDGNVSLDTQTVLTISPMPMPATAVRAFGVVVELTDGSIIRGRQYVARGSRAQITLADGEVIETPVGVVRTVELRADSGGLASEWSRLINMKVDSDLLVVRGEENLDYHKGVLHDVTDAVVRFDIDGEILSVKRAKVFGFAYRHTVEAESAAAAVCRITDSAGSQWSVRSLTLGGKLTWTTPAGLSVARPLESIAQIDFSGGKLVYVSDLTPDGVAWTPYFGGENSLPAAKRFYAPRFDRGFESNPLALESTVYSKGLAVYCRTELVYRLPGPFSRFQAIAGIDDAVRASGKVRLVVRSDDRVLLETTVSGDDAPRAIDLDIKDVRRLTILVDFAGSLSAGDRLLLCNARITK